jgi:hypothetical protein
LLQTDHFAKTKIRKLLGIENKHKIPASYLLPASVLVALVNTSCVMPLDCVKTHMEKVNPQSTYIGAFTSIYNQSGALGFFTGVRLRMVLGFTNALFVTNILERFEQLSLKIKS